MKNLKLKSVIIVVIALMLIQVIVGVADVYVLEDHPELSNITSTLIAIFSLPISLINVNLPFYVAEELYMILLYWVLNVVIQAIVLYGIFKVFKRLKNRSKLEF